MNDFEFSFEEEPKETPPSLITNRELPLLFTREMVENNNISDHRELDISPKNHKLESIYLGYYLGLPFTLDSEVTGNFVALILNLDFDITLYRYSPHEDIMLLKETTPNAKNKTLFPAAYYTPIPIITTYSLPYVLISKDKFKLFVDKARSDKFFSPWLTIYEKYLNNINSIQTKGLLA